MEHYTMNLTLKVWKQKNQDDKGGFETYKVNDISSEMSFLEMFDVLNEKLITEGKEPITFDHDPLFGQTWYPDQPKLPDYNKGGIGF